MKRTWRAVVERIPGGGAADVVEWYKLECGHITSRHKSVMADPKRMYCGRCSRSTPGEPSRKRNQISKRNLMKPIRYVPSEKRGTPGAQGGGE